MGTLGNGIADATNKIGEFADVVGDLVSSRRQFIIKQITNSILLLVILLVFGCFDWMNLKFHYEYLLDGNYWVNIGIKGVADICAYNIGVNFIIDDIIKRNLQLAVLKYQYEKLNEVKQEDFPQFIDIYNRERRIATYKNIVSHKIYLLNRISRRADRITYSKLIKTADISTLKGYAKKRWELEQMKTDEFIEENYEALSVPYKDVDSSIFELEINGSEKIIQNKVTGSVAKGRAIASASTMFGVLAFSVIFTPISLDPNKQEFENQMVAAVNTAVRISTDIGIVVWQFTRGILGTHRIISNQMTIPYAERVKILKLYYEWRKRNGKSVPQVYEDILAGKIKIQKRDGDELEEVTMTEEEYKEFIKNK